jgi:hypothetical protein
MLLAILQCFARKIYLRSRQFSSVKSRLTCGTLPSLHVKARTLSNEWIMDWRECWRKRKWSNSRCGNLPHEYTGNLTGSLWRRQSQQHFNILTPFNFLFFYALHVSAPTGHPQVRYTISYWRTILIQRIRCTYAIWYRDIICCHRYFTL